MEKGESWICLVAVEAVVPLVQWSSLAQSTPSLKVLVINHEEQEWVCWMVRHAWGI